MSDLIDRDDAIEKFQSKHDEIMLQVLNGDALPISATQSMRRAAHILKSCIELLRSLPAAEKGEGRVAVDWPDSVGDWWNSVVSYPCRVTRSTWGDGQLLIGSEASGDKWVSRREWESLVGKAKWVKVMERNPFDHDTSGDAAERSE